MDAAQMREKQYRHLHRSAKEMGYELVRVEPKATATEATPTALA